MSYTWERPKTIAKHKMMIVTWRYLDPHTNEMKNTYTEMWTLFVKDDWTFSLQIRAIPFDTSISQWWANSFVDAPPKDPNIIA